MFHVDVLGFPVSDKVGWKAGGSAKVHHGVQMLHVILHAGSGAVFAGRGRGTAACTGRLPAVPTAGRGDKLPAADVSARAEHLMARPPLPALARLDCPPGRPSSRPQVRLLTMPEPPPKCRSRFCRIMLDFASRL